MIAFLNDICFNLLIAKQMLWCRILRHHRGDIGGTNPYVFTEHGVLMLANVLKSKQAIQTSLHIIDIFIRIREMPVENKDILLKLEQLENRVTGNEQNIQAIFSAVRQLLNPPQKPRERIGFRRKDETG